MNDNRHYHRMNLGIPMKFKVPPRQSLCEATSLDISGTGVCFTTTEELRVRQELLVYLYLPGHENIELHAKVVRVSKESGLYPHSLSLNRIGVKIVEPIKFDERKFVRFYAQKLVEYFGKGKFS